MLLVEWIYLQVLYLIIGFILWSLCSILVSYKSLYFKAYFVWCEYWYISILSISICMEYLLLSLTFSLYLFLVWHDSFLDSIYIGLAFNIHSISLCLLIGTFNPFTFKVVIDMYVPIALFSIVFSLFLSVFFLPFFCSLHCVLMSIFSGVLWCFFLCVCVCVSYFLDLKFPRGYDIAVYIYVDFLGGRLPFWLSW